MCPEHENAVCPPATGNPVWTHFQEELKVCVCVCVCVRACVCVCVAFTLSIVIVAFLLHLQPIYTRTQIRINLNWFDFARNVNTSRVKLI